MIGYCGSGCACLGKLHAADGFVFELFGCALMAIVMAVLNRWRCAVQLRVEWGRDRLL